MANDGIKNRVIDFPEEKLKHFRCFMEWDALPEAEQNLEYEEYIKNVTAGRAVQAFAEYELYKRQLKGGNR